MDCTGTFISLNKVKVSRRLKATPSSMANDVAARVRSSDANERAARAAVEMGRALAHEIGSPEQSVGAGRGFRGFGGEVVIGLRRACRISGERVAKPAQ